MKPRLLFFLLLVAATGLWTHSLRARQIETQHAADLDRIPVQLGPLIGIDHPLDAPSMEALRADRVLSRTYRRPESGESYHLFIAYFGSQETGSQIHSPQNCLPSGGWSILERSQWTVPTQAGPREINEFVIAKGANKDLMHYWFVTRSGVLSNEFALKWDLVRNSLLGLPTDAAMIRLVHSVGPEGLEEARRDLREFYRELVPVLDRAIPIAPRKDPLAFAF